MKRLAIILGVLFASVLVGCSSTKWQITRQDQNNWQKQSQYLYPLQEFLVTVVFDGIKISSIPGLSKIKEIPARTQLLRAVPIGDSIQYIILARFYKNLDTLKFNDQFITRANWIRDPKPEDDKNALAIGYVLAVPSDIGAPKKFWLTTGANIFLSSASNWQSVERTKFSDDACWDIKAINLVFKNKETAPMFAVYRQNWRQLRSNRYDLNDNFDLKAAGEGDIKKNLTK